ncbi:phosphotransferase enzyme family protein [Mycobacterium kansasii]|uniref:Phosphotransferase enzyme family protein n=1 Tax=Mycobacterium kansasii TaxID=1768 RepID=A0A1V3X8M1_MYCKA|nr:phosphotransferase enzyme family protein [Mycobacterium kansasii]
MDLEAVAAWMSKQGLGEGPLQDVSPVTGGTQNVMLRFTRSGRPYVLRRGPRHLRPRSNTVILRETQVLAALAGSDVPHPRLIASCDDPGVLGDAVFYLMEPVEGFNAGEGLPPLHAGDAQVRYGMGLSMADALARLGAVDHVAVGLASFGKPEGFLERQVPRWLSELESYQQYDGYPGRRSRESSRCQGGWSATGRRHGHPASCTVTTTRPMSCSPGPGRTWSPSWTGKCAPSATRCWTWAGCWRPGASPTGPACSATRWVAKAGWPAPTTCCTGMPPTPPATCRTSPGTPYWPASSSAS